MSGFTETALVKKLTTDLNSSQDSIQTLSLWLIHHRRHASAITQVWLRELSRALPNRKLTFLYLANDVVQNSKKRGQEFTNEFGKLMPQALKSLLNVHLEPNTVSSIARLLNIWKERSIFDKKLTESLVHMWKPKTGGKRSPVSTPATTTTTTTTTEPSHKSVASPAVAAKRKKLDVDEVETTPCEPDGSPPPTTNQLLDCLRNLENSASADKAMRERISKFPAHISDPASVTKLDTKAAARSLRVAIEDALKILVDYNKKLAAEIEQRRDLRQMIVNYIHYLKMNRDRLEEAFVEHSSLLAKAEQVEMEVKNHFQSLPDLTKETKVDIRLPPASDLFG